MIYRLTVRGGFAAAHRIVGSGGKCESMHGHNFDVTLTVSGSRLGEAGILMDFGDLKKTLREITGELDHTDLNEHPVFSGSSPSSENIARYIWERAGERLTGRGVAVDSVTVAESDSASATYEPG
ncbi:MAG: 6-carboxytetrahydropterin synthase QueD [bacterium]|nr:6-carboxytetrahydropterin synthase QueD [bacterium]MDT8395984.1 6-carboxytetrahydropterin synthase QueD [bacterium]